MTTDQNSAQGREHTTYPSDMDRECILLCDALNDCPGIKTVESCCGHGQKGFRVFFIAKAIESLAPILRSTESSGWACETFWSNGRPTVLFMLLGPKIGCPGGADDLAGWIKDDLRNHPPSESTPRGFVLVAAT